MKKLIALFLFLATFNSLAINWLLYPSTNSVGPADTFLIGTATTNWQVSGTVLLAQTYSNVVWRGHVSSASNSIPGSPLQIGVTALSNFVNSVSNLAVTASNKAVAVTNNSAIVRSDNFTLTHAVINNNDVSQPPQIIDGSVTIKSNLFVLSGYTWLTSNSAPRVAFSNVIINGGTWVSPPIRGRLRVDMLFSNVVTFSLTNQGTTEFHLGGRTAGSGTNYSEMFIDTNPNDTIQATNLSNGSGGTGLHGSKLIGSFWSEDE